VLCCVVLCCVVCVCVCVCVPVCVLCVCCVVLCVCVCVCITKLTPCCRVYPNKFRGLQLAQKVTAFYEFRRSITTLKPLPPVPILSQIIPVQASPSHCLKSYIIIILPSTPRSSKWYVYFRLFSKILWQHKVCQTSGSYNMSRFE